MDFWWHVKAGEIMLKTRSLTSEDPFAYTRAGLPFLPTHEWLSQLALFTVFRLGGAAGMILLKIGLVVATLAALLRIDRRALGFNSLLAIFALIAIQPGVSERPRLFTYAILAAFLLLAARFWGSCWPR